MWPRGRKNLTLSQPRGGSGALDALIDDGEMGTLMRAHDWLSSPLGAPANWPPSLLTSLNLILPAQAGIALFWGSEFTALYNFAFASIIGDKHPCALGRPASEHWGDLELILRRVRETGETVFEEGRLFHIRRRGLGEEAFFDISCSAVRGEDGGVEGVLCIASETTDSVRARRGTIIAEQEQLAQMFEQAPSFMAMLRGPEHRIEMANPTYLRLIGYRAVLGKTVAKALPEAVEQGYLKLLDEVYRSGKAFSAESAKYVMQAIPGGPVVELFVDFVYQPIKDSAGHVTGIFVEGTDVTERAHTEERMRKSEARLRELNANLERQVIKRTHDRGRTWQVNPDLLGVLNADGYFESSNPAWQTVLGWSEAEIAKTSIFDLIHPDDLEKTHAALNELKHDKLVFRFENRYRHKDGEYRWLSWTGVPEDGKFYCSARDITQKKTQAAELAARTVERDRLWELSEDLLVIADYEGHLLRVSPSWTRLLGYDEATLLKRPYTEIVHPDDFEAAMEVLLRMRASGTAVSFEHRLRAADGSWRWIAWTLSPEPGGERLNGVGRDITGVKVHQAELAVAQEALRQSQKIEAMGQLTGGVAHDFNNLLTPIIGSLDMLHRRGIGGAREQRLIGGALQSAERAKTLVQRLLAFARRQPLQTSAVEVANLLAGMAELVASTLGPQVKVVVEVADRLPPAKADASQLEMAILNLSVNARDAMPEGGTLTILAADENVGSSHRAKLRPGRYVRLTVADTGVGMDAPTMEHAIEPFFSTKGVGKGTGLGLSMVHGLASQLGGAIAISSKPGLGTKVELWLPVCAESAKRVERAAERAPSPKGVGTALLVDDESLVRISTADMLVELGYEVVEAASAEEALGLVEHGLHIDLLVTDHVMVGMTGVELALTFREKWPEVPALIVSGFAEIEGIATDLPRLTKPFRQADLASTVATLRAG